MSHQWGALVIAISLLVGLGGCGSAKPRSASATLTKSEYVARGNSICQQWEQRAKDATSGVGGNTRAGLVEFGKVLLPLLNDLNKELESLVPPAEDKEIVHAMLSKFSEHITASSEVWTAASKGDQSEVIDFADPPSDMRAAISRDGSVGAEATDLFDATASRNAGAISQSSFVPPLRADGAILSRARSRVHGANLAVVVPI